MPAFLMPRLSDTMEEGTITAWLVDDGSVVSRGEEIVEVEGDKATMAVSADADGPLKILRREGTTLSVREPIAWIGEGAPSEAAAPASGTPDAGESEPSPPESAATTPAAPLSASPSARRMAAAHGIDLMTLIGSGPKGRILQADVQAALDGAASEPAPVTAARGEPERVELSRAEQLIARRMATAKATIPDFQLWVEVDMENAFALREELSADGSPQPSLNDFVVRAAALALRSYPRVNGTYGDGAIELHPRVNVGVAVAAEGTLLVPTIFDADRKSLGEIAAETRSLTALARDGSLTPAQTAGATFTVSNLGMFGVDGFRALVSPSQSAILAVGAAVERVVPHAGGIAVRRRLTATLSIDHRIVYGAEAAAFLGHLRTLLESQVEL